MLSKKQLPNRIFMLNKYLSWHKHVKDCTETWTSNCLRELEKMINPGIRSPKRAFSVYNIAFLLWRKNQWSKQEIKTYSMMTTPGFIRLTLRKSGSGSMRHHFLSVCVCPICYLKKKHNTKQRQRTGKKQERKQKKKKKIQISIFHISLRLVCVCVACQRTCNFEATRGFIQ